MALYLEELELRSIDVGNFDYVIVAQRKSTRKVKSQQYAMQYHYVFIPLLLGLILLLLIIIAAKDGT